MAPIPTQLLGMINPCQPIYSDWVSGHDRPELSGQSSREESNIRYRRKSPFFHRHHPSTVTRASLWRQINRSLIQGLKSIEHRLVDFMGGNPFDGPGFGLALAGGMNPAFSEAASMMPTSVLPSNLGQANFIQGTGDQGKFQRSWPQGGPEDSVFLDLSSMSLKFMHDATGINFIQDDEIVRVHLDPAGFSGSLEEAIPYGLDPFGRHVIQQIGMRGCTAAAAAMILLDHGRSVNVYEVMTRNLGMTEDILRDLRNGGLRPFTVSEMPFEEMIAAHGSVIIEIGGEIGHHVVVLDSFYEKANRARIRDPYHGWSIETTVEAIVKRRPLPGPSIAVKP